MVERRKSRRATDDEELDRDELIDEREPSDQDEQEAPGGVEPEPSDERAAELADAGGPELADADESSANGRGTRRGGPARRDRRHARADKSGLTASEAAKTALRQIVELTAKRAEGVTRVQRTEHGWLVGVEVVEDRRIPSSADILATYETNIDADGELMSYRRIRRYTRGRGDGSEES